MSTRLLQVPLPPPPAAIATQVSPCPSPETPRGGLELTSLLDTDNLVRPRPSDAGRFGSDGTTVAAAVAAAAAQEATHAPNGSQVKKLASSEDGSDQTLLDIEEGYGGTEPTLSTPSLATTNRLLGVMAVLIVALLFFAGGFVWVAVADKGDLADREIGTLSLHQQQQQSLLQQQEQQIQSQQKAIADALASIPDMTAAALQKQQEAQRQEQQLLNVQTEKLQQEAAAAAATKSTTVTPFQAAIALPEYRLTVVYFAHLMPNWEKLLDEQLKEVSNIGLGDAADVHVVLSAPAESFDKLDETCEATLAAGEKLAKSILPQCAVHLHAGNRQEYPGIRHLWDLGQHSTHDPSKHFFLYFHAKGMSHEASGARHQLMDTVVRPWRALIARFIEDPELHKQGHTNSMQGFMWYNFFWLRGSYLRDLMAPKLDNTDPNGRYYNEGWSGYLRMGSKMAGECNTPCNWPDEARGAQPLHHPITQVFPCYGPGIDSGTGSIVGCHSGPYGARSACGDAHWKRGDVVSPSGSFCESGPMLKDQPDAKLFQEETRGRIRIVTLNDD